MHVAESGHMRDVFLAFLRLGLTSFGGPIAHLGYFRREFVERRAWLAEDRFAHIVAFCSILPGPTSSQVGMLVGLLRAGPRGALAAWLGFTLPSAVALALFGGALAALQSDGASPLWLGGMLAGLSAAATAIVAQAVLAMAATLCTERVTQTIAIGAAAIAAALHGGSWQWLPIAAGALAGGIVLTRAPSGQQNVEASPLTYKLPRSVSLAAAAAFAAVVAAAAVGAQQSVTGRFLAIIVQAGSLVFGGGHVVLPLLQSLVPAGLVTQRDFYAGYGATQAMPGPLFTFASFLGAVNTSPLHGALGAAVATALIFLPSFLLIFALLPVFDALRTHPAAGGALRGANAAVVGLLGALLYSLVVNLGSSPLRLELALMTFAIVAIWRIPPWVAVVLAAAAGAAAFAAGMAR